MPAHTHAWEFDAISWEEDAASAVGWKATASYHCTVSGCGETDTAAAVIDPAALPDAKCTEEQSVELTATVAAGLSPDGEAHNGTKTVTVQAIGSHDFDETITANVHTQYATCLVDGLKSVKCSRCTETKDTVLPAPGSHDFDDTITANVSVREATCLVDGLKTVKCSRCTETKETVLPAPGSHDFDESIAENVTVVEATCTKAGSKTVKCSRCEETKKTTIKALGHDWGAWVTVTPATDTEEGLKRCTCSRCGKKMERVIPAGNEETPGSDSCGVMNLRALIEAFRNIFSTILNWFKHPHC